MARNVNIGRDTYEKSPMVQLVETDEDGRTLAQGRPWRFGKRKAELLKAAFEKDAQFLDKFLEEIK